MAAPGRPEGYGISSDDNPVSARLWARLLELAAGDGAVQPADGECDHGLWRLYGPVAQAGGERAFVIGQLGQSLDGRIATATGRSHTINGPEAISHLHRLRALVDAVVVGVQTVVADDPRLTVRHASGRNPARIVIDPNFRLPANARMLADDGAAVHAVQSCAGPRPAGMIPVIVPLRDGRLEPAEIVAALAALGYRRILIEGGARTLSAFLSARAVDRLHVAVAPILIGSGPIGITLPAIDALDDAMRPRTEIHRLGRDILFDCALERGGGLEASAPVLQAQQRVCDAEGSLAPAG